MSLEDKKTQESKEFGQWLKRQIEISGKSQGQVAKHIGLTEQQLSRIVTGQSGTRKETIEAICDFIGINKFEAFAKLNLLPSSNIEEEIVMVWHLPRGTRTPVQITDPEVLAATRKAIAEKLKTK